MRSEVRGQIAEVMSAETCALGTCERLCRFLRWQESFTTGGTGVHGGKRLGEVPRFVVWTPW